jgi:hypothetical protein
MTIELIGREDELRLLQVFLDVRELDGPRALVLEGEAGIGKSMLWLRTLELARARGLRVLSSRPAEAERDFALAGLGDLFEGALDEVLPGLAPPTACARGRSAVGGNRGPTRSPRPRRGGAKRAGAARRGTAAAGRRRRRAVARPLLDRCARLRPAAYQRADLRPTRPAPRGGARHNKPRVGALRTVCPAHARRAVERRRTTGRHPPPARPRLPATDAAPDPRDVWRQSLLRARDRTSLA